MKTSAAVMPCAVLAIVVSTSTHARSDDPYADEVIAYIQGSGAAPGYTTPQVVIGSPERFTGEGIFPSVVSPFNPAFGVDEIVSIGVGGSLTVRFNTPLTDDPNNLYGIDLLIFGNAGFIDDAFPSGVVGGLFGNDGGVIEVSMDGANWRALPNVLAEGLAPALGYLDAGPYDEAPGSVLSDFTRPVDPLLQMPHFAGLTHPQLLALYRGSGGGVGVDIASIGLTEISYVRISNPSGGSMNVEIDAFSDVAPRLAGDVNLDGLVNVSDLLDVIGEWGAIAPGAPPADFNLDGAVDVIDLLTVINHWSN